MRLAFITILFFLSFPAFSHPVAYKGAVGVMTWNQPFMTDDWITYSFEPNAAIAARHMRFNLPDGQMEFFAPQFDYLAQRWNEENSQSNVYVYGAYGTLKFHDQNEGSALAGIEADAESRKYFVMGKYERMWGNLGPEFYHSEFRLGIAPYEAEFTEMASWFMLQYQYHPMLIRKETLTPLIRLFYKSVLFETGVSTDADVMINFMFHF